MVTVWLTQRNDVWVYTYQGSYPSGLRLSTGEYLPNGGQWSRFWDGTKYWQTGTRRGFLLVGTTPVCTHAAVVKPVKKAVAQACPASGDADSDTMDIDDMELLNEMDEPPERVEVIEDDVTEVLVPPLVNQVLLILGYLGPLKGF